MTNMENKELEIYDVRPDKDFAKAVKRLIKKKRFYSLPKQIDELISDLEKGMFDGDLITHQDTPTPYDVYKIRLPNPDANVGKSNGYRVIYFVVTESKIVVLLTIYYKKEQEEFDEIYINGLIDGYFMSGLQLEDTDDDEE